MPQTAAVIWADGPSTSPQEPDKSQIRAWGTWLESFISAIGANSGSVFTTRAALFADLAHVANSMAWVIGDSTTVYNGIYRKNGTSGTGSWTRVGDLPYSFLTAVNVGAGTPNAIQATTAIPVSASALIVMNVVEDNTASSVTVSFNGSSALTIKSNSGNNISVGGLTAGMQVLGIATGSEFRLVSDQVSAAIIADAEAAAAAAAASAGTATVAAASAVAAAAAITNIPIVFKAFADLTADTILSYSGSFPVVAGSTVVQVSSKGWNYLVAASGASDHHIVTAGGVKLYALPIDGYVHIEQFFQAGYNNSSTDILASMTKAIALGARIRGTPGRIYGVSGTGVPIQGTWFEDLALKQLAPAATSTVCTLKSAAGVSNITLRRVTVDRNGNGASGSLNGAAGIWLEGGSLHTIDDCEVFGSDAGAGMVFNGCSNFKVNRPYVHDILYVAATLPANDQCMAILFNGCTNFSIFEARINHVGGIVGGSFRRAQGRMLCFGFGCSQFRVYGGEIQDGDVGIDLSGSKGNSYYTVIGVAVRDVETWGIKQSNYNRFGRIVACDVYRAGAAGYVLSGPTVNVDPDTPMPASAPRNITIIGCGAWDTGNDNTGRGTSQPAGFQIMPGAASSYQDYPRGVRFVSCTAVDTQAVKTQFNGFRNEISYGGVPLNEMVDCRSEGYAVGGQHSAGFHYPACRVYNSAAVAIPNNVSTAIGFDSEDYDGAAMHSTSVNNDAIFVPHPGWYHIDAEATVVANATGSRFLGITQGGVVIARLRDQQPGTSANDHTLKLSGDVYISDVAGGIRLTVLQNSGGTLNVNANASLSVRQVLFN
ncbi:hypothetical protein HFO77_23500 [Rhizobium leguminosarum]|uniref:hypothetical protein n=1 Tax=Rhizobium leguminosarum TaxID=384 RepID=UPI001C946DD5|nr:hypothetical protein [Rhizobium leguminosarum]MBY5917362.1 hypothetical protein [Rhizobium leguminosarum]